MRPCAGRARGPEGRPHRFEPRAPLRAFRGGPVLFRQGRGHARGGARGAEGQRATACREGTHTCRRGIARTPTVVGRVPGFPRPALVLGGTAGDAGRNRVRIPLRRSGLRRVDSLGRSRRPASTRVGNICRPIFRWGWRESSFAHLVRTLSVRRLSQKETHSRYAARSAHLAHTRVIACALRTPELLVLIFMTVQIYRYSVMQLHIIHICLFVAPPFSCSRPPSPQRGDICYYCYYMSLGGCLWAGPYTALRSARTFGRASLALRV